MLVGFDCQPSKLLRIWKQRKEIVKKKKMEEQVMCAACPHAPSSWEESTLTREIGTRGAALGDNDNLLQGQ